MDERERAKRIRNGTMPIIITNPIPVPNLIINSNMKEVRELSDAIKNLTDPKNNELFLKALEKKQASNTH